MRIIHVARLMFVFGAFLYTSACTHNAPLAQTPAPIRPPPSLCAPIEPEPDPQGSIVRPITAEEIEATDRFLDGEIELRGWGARGWHRATVAKAFNCG